MKLLLHRFCFDPFGDRDTFGRMYAVNDDGSFGFSCVTVECPWLDNKPFISCIPAGTYKLQRKHFNQGGYDTWEIVGALNRTHILFHKARYSADIEGCVGVGTQFGVLNNRWAILGQSEALKGFLKALDGSDKHLLTIVNDGGAL